MRSTVWDTFMCLDLNRGQILVERCSLSVKTTSDEVEYQFLFDHQVEKIKRERVFTLVRPHPRSFPCLFILFYQYSTSPRCFFLIPLLILVEMCPNRKVRSCNSLPQKQKSRLPHQVKAGFVKSYFPTIPRNRTWSLVPMAAWYCSWLYWSGGACTPSRHQNLIRGHHRFLSLHRKHRQFLHHWCQCWR